MAKKNWNTTVKVSPTSIKGKKTSQGERNLATATMNKNKRRSFKKYRGQGR